MASKVPSNNEESASSTQLTGDADGANNCYSKEINECTGKEFDSFENMIDTASEILPMEAAGGGWFKEESSQNMKAGIAKASNRTTLLNCMEQSNNSEMLD